VETHLQIFGQHPKHQAAGGSVAETADMDFTKRCRIPLHRDILVAPGWPHKRRCAPRAAIFGKDKTGEVELPFGDLPALRKPRSKDFRDTPASRLMLWMLAKDLKMGFHVGLLGAKGAGKSENHSLYGPARFAPRHAGAATDHR